MQRKTKPPVYDCETCGNAIPQAPGAGRIKRWCTPCRNARYVKPKPCLDCETPGHYGLARRCEPCLATREEKRRAAVAEKAALRESDAPLKYTSLHAQLRDRRGRASAFPCSECGSRAQDWAYDHGDRDEVSEFRRGREVRYSLDLSHYRPMCRPCHNSFDARESQARTSCMKQGCAARILAPYQYCYKHQPTVRRQRGRAAGRLDPAITALVLTCAGRETDTCRRCKEEKPVSAFSRDRRRPKGYITLCRPCASAVSLERYYRKRDQAKVPA